MIHYFQAFRELDKDGAEYPRKIGYHNPPNLALEALEVQKLTDSGLYQKNIRLNPYKKLIRFKVTPCGL